MTTPLRQVTEAMKPACANDSWWLGFRACFEGGTENSFKISGPNGEDGVDYWFWEAGWNYAIYNVRDQLDEMEERASEQTRIQKRREELAEHESNS